MGKYKYDSWEKCLRWLGEGKLYRIWPEKLWQRLLCSIFGHDLEQCGIAEHGSHCIWCQTEGAY